ncbi:cilia- and flagella-associated protein 65 isoform X2 [Trichomycterus rosablanca]|uniref:cilia- and flagella-associated protein 65 isoform X2 n=1 Tax=Trichomycterus rosablanca TaxID=2290929 RepID=UPI002F35C567
MLADISVDPHNGWESRHSVHGKVPCLQRSGRPQRKASKHSCLGVETWVELIWEDWEPGRDYTKSLVLKNVDGKLQKLKFRSPASNVFTTLLPQTIILSPGTSFSLPVTFHPQQKCDYVDSIEFQCKNGTFQVKLSAVMLHHALELPESVQLPPCAVQHNTKSSFLLRNVSKLRTSFQWTVEPPFEFSPMSGILEPGEQCKLTVTFKPQEALVYQTDALCTYGENGENNCTMLLNGLSKYPHLKIRSPGQEEGCGLLEFGSVALGSCLEKHFEIYNPSVVTTFFSLSGVKRPNLMKCMFHCDVKQGQLTPGSVLKVPVRFTPLTVDSTNVDYFSLSWPGGVSKDLVKVTGSCTGPDVSLSSSVVDFGCVEEGAESTRTIHITNPSMVLAHYQFDMDHGNYSVFTVDQPSGCLSANSSLTLQLRFHPRHPIVYHKRLACLILHRDSLFIDLIGTCHSEQLKPAILHPRHLHVYRQNLLRGLTCYPPDILSNMLANQKLQVDESGALLLQENSLEDTMMSKPTISLRSTNEEYFYLNSTEEVDTNLDENEDHHCFPPPHVTVQPCDLLFYSGPGSQSVSITNHTKGKISLLWTPSSDSTFSISPLTCDLNPLKSTSFRVTYAPKQHNVLHAAQLECFALYKVLVPDRRTEDQTLCPPWCLTVRVTAHSFQPGNQHFVPQFCLQHPQVLFPALRQVSYKSILLSNTEDLPLIFRWPLEECPGVSVLPPSGLVPPGSHQILTVRATPAEENPASLPLILQLNASPKHNQMLDVVSVAERPCIVLEGDGSVFFRPTAVGSCSKRRVKIRNFSRIPVQFHWRVCSSDHTALSVQPDSGVLHPNAFQVQTWTFTPVAEKMYSMKASLNYWPVQQPNCKKSSLSIKVAGLASKGSIEASSLVLDLGEVLAESCKSFEVPLLNRGSCAVSFSLTVLQSMSVPGVPEGSLKDPVVLEMDSMKGTIPACSRLLIHSTVRPTRRTQYCWTIYYQILNATGSVVGEPQSLCQVRADGVYPTLKVIDARSSGSAEGLSKLHVWKLFSLESLNTYLHSEPSPTELTYRVPTRHSIHRCPPIFTSTMVDFNFSAAPLGAEPSNFLLMFQNTGSIPVDWSFLFPEDQHIKLEYWAESTEFCPNELYQMKVQDNRLFSISPCSGKLQPGQQRVVQFTYRHDFAGTYRIPVLLKLSHGREILLNFVGVTVERDRRYLHLLSTRHIFAPVAIGVFHPPKQVNELYNGGSLPLRYHVDTSVLEQLQEENFNHPVLQCLNPDGEVQPGHTATLEWILSPLEAKTYTVDIPIEVLDGDSMLLTFEGCGFDERGSVPLQLHDGQLTVPCTQKVPVPCQMVFLSEERVSFGDIPVCSRGTRILFLTNVSHTDRVLYSWKCKKENDKQVVKIYPVNGSLSAGESVLCILSIHTSSSPMFYQQHLICEITPEAAIVQYEKDLRLWEEESEREKHHFVITEKDLIQTNQQNRLTKACRATEVRISTESRKYKTLPPIRSNSSDAVFKKNAQEEVGRRCPKPPCPALLHLGVTARSHSLLEYQTQFPSQFNKHYIYRSVPSTFCQYESKNNMPSSTHMPAHTYGPERDILIHTLTSLLRSLLDDPDFHQTLQNDSAEPVPYFTQLRPAFPAPSPNHSSPTTKTPHSVDTVSVSVPRTSTQHTESSDDMTNSQKQSEGQCGTQICKELDSDYRTKVQESIRSPEFGDLIEEILLNTLQNLMMEAFLGELILTARPRIIALPPCSARSQSDLHSLRDYMGHNYREQSNAGVLYDKTKDQQRPSGTRPGPYMPTIALLTNLESEQH